MKSVVSFLKAHSYGLFVTALVLTLGLVSWRLRSPDAPASAEQPVASPTPPPAATPAPTAAPSAQMSWRRPVSGGILTEYSYAVPVWNASMDCWQCHEGVDLAAATGETVQAAADGEVLSVENDPLLGLTVRLSHEDGWESAYASLQQTSLQPGDRVKAGDAVGVAGNSADCEALLGTHVHFSLSQNSLPVKPAFQP